MDKVAIVNSGSFGKHFPEHIRRLEEHFLIERVELHTKLNGEELAAQLSGYKYLIVSTSPHFDRQFFEHVNELVLISRHGIGCDNIDIQAATKKGVIVTKVPGFIEQEAVAEHAVALCLSILRHVANSNNKVKIGKWSDRYRFIGFELKGRTVGIIGYGNIGRRVGEILMHGFGSRVLAYDPNISDEFVKLTGAKPAKFSDLLSVSDVIFICAARTTENYHMISDKEFAIMKNGVLLVNISRGELVDTVALLHALEHGKLGGYAADVVEGEPIGPDHPLLRFENVVITPHIAAYTYECLKGMGEKVVDDVLKASNLIIPDEIVNVEIVPELEKRGWRRAND